MLQQKIKNIWGIGISLNNLGNLAFVQGNYEDAHQYYLESLGFRREINAKTGIANSLTNLGFVAKNQGNYQAANHYHQEGLILKQIMGDKRGIAYNLHGLAAAKFGLIEVTLCSEAEAIHSFVWIARLEGAVTALLERISAVLEPAEMSAYEQILKIVYTKLGEFRFTRYFAEGQDMSLEEVIKYALKGSPVLATSDRRLSDVANTRARS